MLKLNRLFYHMRRVLRKSVLCLTCSIYAQEASWFVETCFNMLKRKFKLSICNFVTKPCASLIVFMCYLNFNVDINRISFMKFGAITQLLYQVNRTQLTFEPSLHTSVSKTCGQSCVSYVFILKNSV